MTGNSNQSERAEWVNLIGSELPLDAGTLFPETTGFFVKRRNKARAQLLLNLKPLLLQGLKPGEQVRYAAVGIRYSLPETLVSGPLLAQLTNRQALVVTSERIFLIYLTRTSMPADIKNQLVFTQIVSAARHGLFGAYFRIVTADGVKTLYSGLSGADKKQLAMVIPQQGSLEKSQRSLEHLCPSCLQGVPGEVGSTLLCPNAACRIPFRDPRLAAKYSALVPGIGDVYLRHHFLGMWEYMGSMLLLGVGSYCLLVALLTSSSEERTLMSIMTAILLVLPRLLDYALTLHIGKKGLVPLALRPVIQGVNRGRLAENSAIQELPRFPGWSYGVFGVGFLLYASSLLMVWPAALGAVKSTEAQALAQQGDFVRAMEVFSEAETSFGVNNDDRARLALALYRAGDWTDGDFLMQAVGESLIEEKLADDINAFHAETETCAGHYEEGFQSLLEGQFDEGWKEIDQALVLWSTVKQPKLPGTRDDVRVELLQVWLRPDLIGSRLPMVQRTLVELNPEVRSPVLAVVQARLAALQQRSAEVSTLLKDVDFATLPVDAQLLAMEARAHAFPSYKESIAADAEKIQIQEGSIVRGARRAVLMALGGKPSPELNPEALTYAREIAVAQGFESVIQLLVPAPVPTAP